MFDKLLGEHDGKYYCANTGDSYFDVTVLDSQFTKIKEVDLSKALSGGEYCKVFNYLFLENKFYVFYFDDRKRVSHLLAGEIDFNTLELKDSLHEIVTMNDPPRVSQDPVLDALWRFDIHYSPDGNYFVINYMQDKKSHFVVYNSKLEKQYATEYSFYLSQYFEALQVSNSGTVVLVHKTAPGLSIQPWEVVVMHNGNLSQYMINIDMEYKLFRATVGFTESDRPYVLGYFWYFKAATGIYDLDKEVRNLGTYYFSPGENDNKIKLDFFPYESIVEIVPASTKKDIDKEHAEGKPIGIEGIYDAQLFTNSNGRVYLVGEEKISNDFSLGLNFAIVGQNSITTIHTEGNPKTFFENLYVTQFDTSGNMIANTWVMKDAVENMYASYRAIMRADTLYVVYNDNYLNIKDKPRDGSEVKTLRPMLAGMPVVMAIMPGGEKKEILPFPDKDYSSLIILNAIPTDSETFLFQRKKFNTTGFEFCLMKFP